MKVEIWSDVVCPWCYVGKRNLASALAQFDNRDHVEIRWRSFELNPSAPALIDGDYAGRLASKYRVSLAEAQAMIDRVTEAGAKVGLRFSFADARPGNTFDAHRLIHLAAEHGIQDAVKEKALAATFVEGRPIGDRETLVGIAAETGLAGDEARSVLESDAYADDVRADEQLARALGITAVPFFVVDRTYGASGAQPPGVLLDLLRRAWKEKHANPVLAPVGNGAGLGCEDEGCAV